jgi:hypothetical protein
VRNQDCGFAPCRLEDAVEDFEFSTNVELGRGLIKNDKLRSELDGAQRPRYGDTLPLTP